MIGERVQRRAYLRTERNAHGKETHILDAPAVVWALAFAPEQSAEPRETGGTRVVMPATLYLPPRQETDPRDIWIVRGVSYAADGAAADWRSPFTGRTAGLALTLRRVTG